MRYLKGLNKPLSVFCVLIFPLNVLYLKACMNYGLYNYNNDFKIKN